MKIIYHSPAQSLQKLLVKPGEFFSPYRFEKAVLPLIATNMIIPTATPTNMVVVLNRAAAAGSNVNLGVTIVNDIGSQPVNGSLQPDGRTIHYTIVAAQDNEEWSWSYDENVGTIQTDDGAFLQSATLNYTYTAAANLAVDENGDFWVDESANNLTDGL